MEDMTMTDAQKSELDEHRDTLTGQFGERPDHQAEFHLMDGANYLRVTGDPVTTVMLYENGGYESYTLAAAREKLGIARKEPYEVVVNTIALLTDLDEDYPPYVTQETGYESPKEGDALSTAEWYSIGGAVWEPAAEVHVADWEVRVAGLARIDPDAYGLSENLMALEAIIANTAGPDNVRVADGKIHVVVQESFQRDEFEPRLVADSVDRKFRALNPLRDVNTIKESGHLFDDHTISASFDVDGRAVAYAAALGRTPNDAEAIAAARAFAPASDLAKGFMVNRNMISGIAALPKELEEPLKLWNRGREAREGELASADA